MAAMPIAFQAQMAAMPIAFHKLLSSLAARKQLSKMLAIMQNLGEIMLPKKLLSGCFGGEQPCADKVCCVPPPPPPPKATCRPADTTANLVTLVVEVPLS